MHSQYAERCPTYNIHSAVDGTDMWGAAAMRDDKPANISNVVGCLNAKWCGAALCNEQCRIKGRQ